MVKMLGFIDAGRYKQVSVWLVAVVFALDPFMVVQVVLDIALGAAAEGRPASLAVVYDELFRKMVENKSGQLGQSWDFAKLFTHVDDNILRDARRQAVCLLCRFVWCFLVVSQESATSNSSRYST